MQNNTAAAVTNAPANTDVTANAAFEIHANANGTEEEHIQKALEASQTAMEAIGTVTDLATYTLTILGIIIALVAIFGGAAILRAARATAKQIANKRFDSYMQSPEFKEMVKVRVERSIDERWQRIEATRLEEEVRDPADPQPFDPPPPNPVPPGEGAE